MSTALLAFETSLTPRQARLVRGLSSPFKIQTCLDELPYSTESRYRCPLSVVRDRVAHCYDGAVFAAAMLQRLGHRPLLVELIPNGRDDDHMLALFKQDGCWGAVAQSNYVGLRYRDPVYRSLRELTLSYFELYFNVAGEKTMRGYTRPLNLKRFDRLHWMTRDEALEDIGQRLDEIPQVQLITPRMSRRLQPVDRRSYEAGTLGVNRAGVFRLPKSR